jgi:hypothetical protein
MFVQMAAQQPVSSPFGDCRTCLASNERTCAIAIAWIAAYTEMATAHYGSQQGIENNGEHSLSLIPRILRELKIRNREF